MRDLIDIGPVEVMMTSRTSSPLNDRRMKLIETMQGTIDVLSQFRDFGGLYTRRRELSLLMREMEEVLYGLRTSDTKANRSQFCEWVDKVNRLDLSNKIREKVKEMGDAIADQYQVSLSSINKELEDSSRQSESRQAPAVLKSVLQRLMEHNEVDGDAFDHLIVFFKSAIDWRSELTDRLHALESELLLGPMSQGYNQRAWELTDKQRHFAEALEECMKCMQGLTANGENWTVLMQQLKTGVGEFMRKREEEEGADNKG